MSTATRILPELTPENTAFWTGGSGGQLMITRCTGCGYYIHPPQPICARCLGEDVAPQAVSGRGHVHSFTINHQPWRPGLAVPYALAIVELVEQAGLRLTTNIVDCPLEDVGIGMPVEVVFEQADDIWLPLFRPLPDR